MGSCSPGGHIARVVVLVGIDAIDVLDSVFGRVQQIADADEDAILRR